jgi:prepilin-type N-terminal cleavage/methylation domain-containing protein
MKFKKGFTLIELLVVIAIIAILSVVVILTLNPAELLKQSRDSSRLSDLATINSALGIYSEDQSSASNFTMGSALTTYTSMPDTTATSTAGDQCQGLNLLALPTGDTYHCTITSSNRNIDGTGWIPVDFKLISSGSPIGNLPVDPTNQSSSNLYYTYTTNGTQYEITTSLESQKYKSQYVASPSSVSSPGIAALGSNLALSEVYNPTGLVAYWNFEEGSGSSILDKSGNGATGVWVGSASGTNGTYYTSGEVGSYAGDFNGINNKVTASISFPTSTGSFSLWINPTTTNLGGGNAAGIISDNGNYFTVYWGAPSFCSGDIDVYFSAQGDTCGTAAPTLNQWNLLVIVWGSGAGTDGIYLSGIHEKSTAIAAMSQWQNPLDIGGQNIGNTGINWFKGSIDDVRVYNRALSAAEVQALYIAEH